jgi:hypothetical protein
MIEQKKRISRRSILIGIGTTAAAYGLGVATPGLIERLKPDPVRDAYDAVLPSRGTRTTVVFGDSLLRLVRAGTIDPEKFSALYAARGGVPDWVRRLFESSSSEPILISSATAPYLLNLLWPLGLATKTRFNADSPLNGKRLATLASTAGWRLGRAGTGAAYFNKVTTLELSAEQEARVLAVARKTFRPCCNNSAFFQDCNHGSAMLGLLELGAAQGLSKRELYGLARTANGYWYPSQYVEMALFFATVQDTLWKDVDPARAVGAGFASASGWHANVRRPLLQTGLLEQAPRQPQAGCSA